MSIHRSSLRTPNSSHCIFLRPPPDGREGQYVLFPLGLRLAIHKLLLLETECAPQEIWHCIVGIVGFPGVGTATAHAPTLLHCISLSVLNVRCSGRRNPTSYTLRGRRWMSVKTSRDVSKTGRARRIAHRDISRAHLMPRGKRDFRGAPVGRSMAAQSYVGRLEWSVDGAEDEGDLGQECQTCGMIHRYNDHNDHNNDTANRRTGASWRSVRMPP